MSNVVFDQKSNNATMQQQRNKKANINILVVESNLGPLALWPDAGHLGHRPN